MKRQNMIQSVNKTKNVKQKIVIVGDSHVMNCVAKLQYSLGTIFAISSFVKPGAGMSVITDTVEEEIIKLKSDDVVVG
jgi:hypothetical protein